MLLGNKTRMLTATAYALHGYFIDQCFEIARPRKRARRSKKQEEY